MKRTRLFLILSFAMLAMPLFAQKSKLTPQARILMAKHAAEHASLTRAKSQKAMPGERSVLSVLFLDEGRQLSEDSLRMLGVRVMRRCGNMLLANVPVGRLADVAQQSAVKLVNTGRKMRLTNDKSRQASSVVFLHEKDIEPTAASLPSVKDCKYRGKGILACVIDGEIDFMHPAFRNADGTSRLIEAIMSEVDVDGNVVFNRYDNPEDANEKQKNRTVTHGHGTHVSGIVAGSTDALAADDAMRKYYGMAPEADLLLYDSEDLTDTELLGMIDYAFQQSDATGQPVVVNMSIGYNTSQLDGTDSFAMSLNEIFAEHGKEGKVVCVSAGNEGDKNISVQMNCNKPIQNADWTMQKKVAVDLESDKDSETGKTIYTLNATIDFYSRSGKEYAVKYEFYEYNGVAGSYRYVDETELLTKELLEAAEDLNLHFDRTTDLGNKMLIDITPSSSVSSKGGYLFMADMVAECSKNTRIVVNIYTKEEGVQIDGCLNAAEFADIAGADYAVANGYGSFNGMACSENVVSVGAYNTRIGYTDATGVDHYYFSPLKIGKVGDISVYSSYVSGHYGVARPDVVAPGTEIISSMHSRFLMKSLQVGYSNYAGTTYPWGVLCGTSMSCPAVSGIVALWLQANPQLTSQDVKAVIRETSDYDSYCEKWKERAGYGKINALRGLEYVVATTGIRDISPDSVTISRPVKYLTPDHRLVLQRGSQRYNAAGARLWR